MEIRRRIHRSTCLTHPGLWCRLAAWWGPRALDWPFALDILSGGLSPAGWSRANPEGSGNGLFVQAIRIEAFRPLQAFEAEVGRFVDYVKSARCAPGVDEILVPGERSYGTRQKRLVGGIPVEAKTWERVAEIAKRLGVRL